MKFLALIATVAAVKISHLERQLQRLDFAVKELAQALLSRNTLPRLLFLLPHGKT